MTRKRKKLLAVVLVLAMSGSMMIVAWANTDPENQATIEFTGDWVDGIIPSPGPGPTDPPTDPNEELPDQPPPHPPDVGPADPHPGPNVQDPPGSLIATNSLNFWNHDAIRIRNALSPDGLNFHSIRSRNDTWDTSRGNGNQSRAGLWVRASEYDDTGTYSWSVDVAISGFDGGDVLQGFRLLLQPIGNAVVTLGDLGSTTFRIPQISADVDGTVGAADRILDGTADFIGGANYEGRLHVPVNANVEIGAHQAEMFWTFTGAAP